jgi:GrpB-like predicted nucleotidyltransferase (UPF0157 family)
MTDQESLQRAIHEEIALAAYDPAWAGTFQAERDRLHSLFPQILAIEHIGSTAVIGLAAKPVIDLMAGVADMAVAEALAGPLCQVGYTTSAEFNASLQDRKWFMRWADGHRTHHLHVMVQEGKRWKEHLIFRDALRTDAGLAARYGALKHRLAATHGRDREAYTAAKATFVNELLRNKAPRPAS